LNGGQSIASRGGSKVVSSPSKPIRDAEASATLRDQLVAEIKNLSSSETAAMLKKALVRLQRKASSAPAAMPCVTA
jgi:hypothetical protein